MRIRRAIAILVTLCLALSLLPASYGLPTLVCRYTGAPMPAAVQSARSEPPPCCRVQAHLDTDGNIRYHLTAPGCCVLRQSPAHSLTAVITIAPPLPVATLTAVPDAIPAPGVEILVSQTLEQNPDVCRPPPLLASAAPRGPPSVS